MFIDNFLFTTPSASLCPVLPAEPGGQAATNIDFDGDIRLMAVGATYTGECAGYLSDPAGAAATAATVDSCPAGTLTARTHYSKRTGAGAYEGVLVILPHAGMSTGSTYVLNVTFAQDVDAGSTVFATDGSTTATINQGVRANNLLIKVAYEGLSPLHFAVPFDSAYKEEQLCLYDIDCSYTTAEDFWDGLSVSHPSTPLSLAIQQAYDAEVEYECGYGRGFDIPNWPTQLPKVLSVRCNDQQQWIYEDPTSDITDDVFDENTMPVCKCKYKQIR